MNDLLINDFVADSGRFARGLKERRSNMLWQRTSPPNGWETYYWNIANWKTVEQ